MKVVMEVKVVRTTLTPDIFVPQKQREVYLHLKRNLEFYIE